MDHDLRTDGQVALGGQILQDSLAGCKSVRTRQDSVQRTTRKASREVRARDLLQVKNDGGDFQVKVLLLSEVRGPAAVAQTLYCETEESRDLRLKLAEERKTLPHFEASREGKPSKRDRRELSRLRGRS